MKKTVGILFGGQSAEHEISLRSAESLIRNLNREKFTPRLIFIDKKGSWRPVEEKDFQDGHFGSDEGFSFLPWNASVPCTLHADIYFPMLHGPNGEDGKIQSLLELAGKPYVGANSFSSALAMDKVVSKIMFRNAGLNVGDFLWFEHPDYPIIQKTVGQNLGYPVFVKPSFMGSSVGISKVKREEELIAALDLAFRYDHKILVEKGLDIREIEVSVMGNEDIMVSQPAEVIPFNEFYDYNDKYIGGKTTFHIPAQLDGNAIEKIRAVAGTAFKTLFLNGMSRVDLFLEKNSGEIYINEINTIPGFTSISMFPKLWTLQGIDYTELISRLIDYGFAYFHRHQASTDWRP